jgi:predicted Na+-dependent transporter
LSAKIAAVAYGLFGLLFHILFVGVLTGNVVTADIGVYFESIGILLLIPVISMAMYFRKAMTARAQRLANEVAE